MPIDPNDHRRDEIAAPGFERAGRLRRRVVAILGAYASVALSIVASLVLLRTLGPRDAGRYTVVAGTVAFFDQLLKLTSDEALVKFGFRYVARGEWGRFRRLVRQMFGFELAASLVTGGIVAGLAPFAGSIVNGANDLVTAFLIASVLPMLQSVESMGAAALTLRGRYDVRGLLLTFSMALRLVGIAVGAQFGVTEAVAGVVAAQIVTTATLVAVGVASLNRFPRAASEPLGEDRAPLLRFVLQSSADTALVSLRTWIAPLALGVVRTATEVGYFRGAQAPQTGFAALSSPVRSILFTEQTHDWEHGRIGAVISGARRYVLGSVLLMAVVLPPVELAMPWLVRVALGSDYSPAVEAARLMVAAAAVQLVFGWTKSLPVTVGRPGLRIVAHLIEAAVLLPLILFLGDRYGVTGAAGAVLVSTCVFAAVWIVFVRRLRDSIDWRGDLDRERAVAS